MNSKKIYPRNGSVRHSCGFAIHRKGASKLLGLFLTLLLLFSCTDMHAPLLHTAGKVEVKPGVEQHINVETMWQADWQSKWQVSWNEATMGKIGYTKPETFHLDYYQANGSWLNDRDMASNSIRVDLGYGTYDLLLYNNDLSTVNISQDNERKQVIAYTEEAQTVALPDSLKQKLCVKQMPDELFSVYTQDVVVSDRLEDYTYVPEENIYLLKLNAELEPRTFIYLIQAELLNSDDKVSGCGSGTVSGLAEQVNLKNTEVSGSPIAHQFPMVFERRLQEDGSNRTLLGGRLLTFGRYQQDDSSASPSDGKQEYRQFCYLALRLTKGGAVCIPVDITEQMKALPKGGVINITLDLKDFTPSPEGNGGWSLDVDGWHEENHHQPL